VLLCSQLLRQCHLQHIKVLPQQQIPSSPQQLQDQEMLLLLLLLLLLKPSRCQHRHQDCRPLVSRAHQQELRQLLP
jgi:hypothetical protein